MSINRGKTDLSQQWSRSRKMVRQQQIICLSCETVSKNTWRTQLTDRLRIHVCEVVFNESTYLWTSPHLCRLFRSTILTSSGFGAPNLFFFRFLKCKWQWRARSQLRDVKHALWTLWHSSANCFSRTYVHAVFKAALLNLSNTFCVRRAFRLKTHLAPWPYSFISRADVTFKCYQYLNSDVALTRASSQADTSAMFMSFTPRQVLWQYCLASNSPKI